MYPLKINSTFRLLHCLFFIFFSSQFFSQSSWCTVDTPNSPNGCTDGQIVDLPQNQSQIEFVFDSFAKWNSGITLYGASILKIIAKQDTVTPSAPSCYWKLRMLIDNIGSNADEWKTDDSYGTGSGNKPNIEMLKLRVDNGCHTPQNTDFQWFQNDQDIIDIINPGSGLLANNTIICSGAPNSETNGSGTYLGPDYNEFTFTIDYKIVPQVGQIPGWAPGRYTLLLKFCLSEQ
jgi:hypothetical protein